MLFGYAFVIRSEAFSGSAKPDGLHLCKSGQYLCLCSQRRKTSNILLFLFNLRKVSARHSDRWTDHVHQLQRNSSSLAESLHKSLRSIAILQIGILHHRVMLFLCEGNGGFAKQSVSVRYHHETTLLIESRSRTFLNYGRIPSVTLAGHPDNSLIFRAL